ncbi:hypothetical protein KUCAC02_025198 [Chaenocephalus aceratus]|nr:hypothetical protein KUCAC02_025198 [Chaenocephalus aceratus]
MATRKTVGPPEGTGQTGELLPAQKLSKADGKRHIAALILARGRNVWVSTDHDEIEKVAKAWGAQVHRRSPEVSKDSSSSLDTIQEFSRLTPEVDVICHLQADVPLPPPVPPEGGAGDDHGAGIRLRVLRGAQTPVSLEGDQARIHSQNGKAKRLKGKHFTTKSELEVVKHDKNLQLFAFTSTETEEKTFPFNLTLAARPRRQDWDGELCENGSFYFTTTEMLLKEQITQGGKVAYYEMLPEYSVDIDVDIDWPVAEQRVLRFGYFGAPSPEVVRLMFCNISGCLTGGHIFMSVSGEEMVSINIRDTRAIRMLQKEDIEVILLTSDLDPVAKLLTDRLTERTGCQVVQVGDEPLDLLRKMVEEKKLQWKDVAYMGSDQQDVSCLNLAGMSAVPGDAPNVAINASKYTCRKMGGTGALREFAEHILLQKEKAKSHREQHRIDRINF